MTMHTRLLAVIFLICCNPTFAQGLAQMMAEIHSKQDAADKALRDAIIELRDARLRSCGFRESEDCDLAALSGIELTLLELEVKYSRASRTESSISNASRQSKLKGAAAEARRKISDLEALLKRVGE